MRFLYSFFYSINSNLLTGMLCHANTNTQCLHHHTTSRVHLAATSFHVQFEHALLGWDISGVPLDDWKFGMSFSVEYILAKL